MDKNDIYFISGKILYSNDQKYIKILGMKDKDEYYYIDLEKEMNVEEEMKSKSVSELIQNYLVLKPSYVLSIKKDIDRKSSILVLNSYKGDKLVYIFNLNNMNYNILNCFKTIDDYNHNADQTTNISAYPITTTYKYGYLNSNSFKLLDTIINIDIEGSDVITELEILINNWIATNYGVYNFNVDFDFNKIDIKTFLQSIIPNYYFNEFTSYSISDYDYNFDINKFKKENPSHNIILVNLKNSSHLITYSNLKIGPIEYNERFESITGFNKEEMEKLLNAKK